MKTKFASINNKLDYLGAMGIDVWVRRKVAGTAGVGANPTSIPEMEHYIGAPEPDDPVKLVQPGDSAPNDSVEQLDWEALRVRVASCTACGLHKTRTQTVFGVGSRSSRWMFIGEAPGAEEDRQGEPFVGRAGQLLNAMLQAIGLKREPDHPVQPDDPAHKVFIANILKCRPPRNRDPLPEEVGQCESYLRRQVQLIQPDIIVALGRVAAQNLLKTDTSIGRLRGKRYCYGDDEIPLVVTYHPAYLLRSPMEKRKVWEDLLLAMAIKKGAKAEK